jgi:hypothetical protein
MYHPGPATAAEVAAGFSDEDGFEYIELQNIGSQHIDLREAYFSEGVRHLFGTDPSLYLAPGARILLVADPAAFQARYGSGRPIAGRFSGTLDNAGERLTLRAPDGSLIKDFIYEDVAPWPLAADGTGYSLVLQNPSTNPDHGSATSWRASAGLNGSPGLPDGLTYPAWLTMFGLSGNETDSDFDGLDHVLEYALGGLVPRMDVAHLPTFRLQPHTVGGVTETYLTVSHRRRLNTTDVAFAWEQSSTLATASWTPAGFVQIGETPVDDSTVLTTWRAAAPYSAAEPRQLYRLRVTIQP